MAINVSIHNYSGSLPDIILLTQGYYNTVVGEPSNCHDEVVFIAYLLM